MGKVYDVVTFFNELDVLSLRINILDRYVDYFVVIEASTTFSGDPKPLVYLANSSRFAAWAHKIIYFVMPEFPRDVALLEAALKSPNTGSKEDCWVREFYYKESTNYALSGCKDNDIIFVSDVDEIWNPATIRNIQIEQDLVYRPIQTPYLFYLNNRSQLNISNWTGTRFGKYSTYKKYGANHFRTEKFARSVPVENGGWHFMWIANGIDKVEKDNHAAQGAKARYNAIKNEKTWIDNDNLPEYILKNKDLLVKSNLMLK